MGFTSRKNGFHKPENPFPPAGMKYFVEKYFSARRKKTNTVGKRMVSTSQKINFPLASIIFP